MRYVWPAIFALIAAGTVYGETRSWSTAYWIGALVLMAGVRP